MSIHVRELCVWASIAVIATACGRRPAADVAPSATAASQPGPGPATAADFLPTLIRPDSFLPIPNPFPVDTPADRSELSIIRARNTAPRVWAMSHARPCNPVKLADTTGWQNIVPSQGPRPSAVTAYPGAGAGGARVLLPKSFERDTAFRSYHGGYGWVSGTTKFRMESGYWGAAYQGKVVTACRATTTAGSYIVQESMRDGLYSFHAFPVDSVWRPSLMISGIATTEEGLRIPWTAFALMTPP